MGDWILAKAAAAKGSDAADAAAKPINSKTASKT
jgi:hypothetical protein